MLGRKKIEAVCNICGDKKRGGRWEGRPDHAVDFRRLEEEASGLSGICGLCWFARMCNGKCGKCAGVRYCPTPFKIARERAIRRTLPEVAPGIGIPAQI
jgi:hypothetical protein